MSTGAVATPQPGGRVVAGPARLGAVLVLLSSLVLLAASVPADPAGRLLLVPAGLALAGVAIRDLLLRPVLLADPDSLELVEGWRRVRHAWGQVESVRLVTDRRAPLLEVDLGHHLVVLSRRRLGRPPYEVAEELTALRRQGSIG